MLADENPEFGALGPKTIGGTLSIHLYVEDVDAVVANAVAAGVSLTRQVADQFYGDRVGGITDPFGHRWFVATHEEDLTIEEIQAVPSHQGIERQWRAQQFSAAPLSRCEELSRFLISIVPRLRLSEFM